MESLGIMVKKEKRKAKVKPRDDTRHGGTNTEKSWGRCYTGGNHLMVEDSVLQEKT